MRILAIRGQGLASLARPFEVSFEDGPLGAAGVFAIVGATGAGKSTLLDAMCLSLFDHTPRLGGRGVKADHGDGLSVGDPRNVVRRGVSFAWAECDFRGSNGVAYRARWEVRQKARGLSGLRESALTLCERATGLVVAGGKKQETVAAIESKLGLGFEQFRRAVMLPQGEFAAFLEADEKLRAELLERMTGSEIYGRISIEVAARARQVRAVLAAAEEQVSRLVGFSPEEQTEIERALSATQLDVARARDRVRALETQESFYRDLRVRQSELDGAHRELALLSEQLDLWGGRRGEIEEARRLAPAIALLRAFEARASELEQAEARHQAAERRVNDARSRVRVAEQRLEPMEREETPPDPNAWAELPEADRRIGALLLEGEFALTEATAQERRAEAARRKIEAEIECVRGQVAATEDVSASRERLRAARAGREGARTHLERLLALREHAEAEAQLRQEALGLERRIVHHPMRWAEAEAERALAVRALDALEHASESMTRTRAALELRAELATDDPCPVCGSRERHEVSPLVVDGPSDIEISIARARVQRAGEHLARLDGELEMLRAQRARMQAGLEHLGRDLDRRWAGVASASGAARPDLAALEAACEDARTQYESASALVEEAERREQELYCQQEHLSRLREAHREALHRWTRARERSEAARLEVNVRSVRWRERVRARRLEAQEDHLEARAQEAAAEARHLECQHARALAAAQHSEARAAVDRALARLGATYEDALRALRVPEEEIVSLERELASIDRRRTLAEGVLAERSRRLEEHRSPLPNGLRPEPELEKELDESRQLLARREVELTLLTLRRSEGEQRATRLAEAEDELAQSRDRARTWNELDAAIGSADGKRFRLYAQSLTLDRLLEHANAHLAHLSPRYSLQRSKSSALALTIFDSTLGEHRGQKSLSGGETFLVSLALALGLASMASHRVRIDSLFLDEGFGTLDAESLEVALSALERLHAGGRQVGIISHVAAIAERFPARVEVRAAEGGTSRVIVHGVGSTTDAPIVHPPEKRARTPRKQAARSLRWEDD